MWALKPSTGIICCRVPSYRYRKCSVLRRLRFPTSPPRTWMNAQRTRVPTASSRKCKKRYTTLKTDGDTTAPQPTSDPSAGVVYIRGV
ncbi:hypothetical protein DPMN_052888 [Dreissena polymorpha]|uniref:Uncharacterized protein n=1 Tax=Dreissena polymorpha TaxID=45954 RepID=A0A9D4CMQ7_DREPO|nr:hypothetical protein DPMN_052888 [Dreissena polymorpha]